MKMIPSGTCSTWELSKQSIPRDTKRLDEQQFIDDFSKQPLSVTSFSDDSDEQLLKSDVYRVSRETCTAAESAHSTLTIQPFSIISQCKTWLVVCR